MKRNKHIVIGFEWYWELVISLRVGWGARGRKFKSCRPDQ